MFKRPIFNTIFNRFLEERRFIQVLEGPRQTGKTTLAKQLIEAMNMPAHYASADEPSIKSSVWVEQQWETARSKINSEHKKAALVLDEIQKIPDWADIIKRLWDEDTFKNLSLYVVILGSSRLLLHKGLTESLAGRFELTPVTHWSFSEMRDAFGWDADKYIFYGGYPGSALLVDDNSRWINYIKDSLIETTISRDILLMTRVDKPALLRRLFELGCSYSGQMLSYQKILGQLQDAGNTTTLANYLNLLEKAGLLAGLSKYAGQKVRQRASSPKFLVLNTALLSANLHIGFSEIKADKETWGHFVESSAGAWLYNAIKGTDIELFYWNEGNFEVDFVLKKGERLAAIEVKSGRKKTRLPGIETFSGKFDVKKKILAGEGGISIEDFLLTAPEKWFE